MSPLHKDLQIKMKNTYLILLTTEMYFLIVECAIAPDINLEGRLIANNDSKVLQLSCSTNIAVQLCTVEFLRDNKTHDGIRYFDNNCFHTMWICSPKVCTCSGDCKSFTLNVTVTQDMKNTIYSCASRIENKGVIYSANISIIQDGNGGSTIFKKNVVPSNIVTPPHQATTFTPEISTVASFIPAAFLISGVLCGLLILLIVIGISILCRMKYCSTKSEWKKSSSHLHDLGESASQTLKCSEKQNTVRYSGNKEKRLTTSGSLHSLEDVKFLISNISSMNDSSDA